MITQIDWHGDLLNTDPVPSKECWSRAKRPLAHRIKLCTCAPFGVPSCPRYTNANIRVCKRDTVWALGDTCLYNGHMIACLPCRTLCIAHYTHLGNQFFLHAAHLCCSLVEGTHGTMTHWWKVPCTSTVLKFWMASTVRTQSQDLHWDFLQVGGLPLG